MRQNLSEMNDEIWGKDKHFLDLDLEDHQQVLAPVAEAVAKAGAAMEAAAEAVKTGQREIAGEMAGVLGDVVRLMREGHDGLTASVKASEAGALAKGMEQITAKIDEDGKKTRAAIANMLGAIEGLGRLMSGVEAAIRAPKRLVKDRDGKPVGVEVVG